MEFIVALDTEHHCFAPFLNHLSFPGSLAFQASRFMDRLYFYLTASDTALLTITGEQASCRLFALLVTPASWG
jgi:hypothetical protein